MRVRDRRNEPSTIGRILPTRDGPIAAGPKNRPTESRRSVRGMMSQNAGDMDSDRSLQFRRGMGEGDKANQFKRGPAQKDVTTAGPKTTGDPAAPAPPFIVLAPCEERIDRANKLP